mgnify:CR=1 FL=1
MGLVFPCMINAVGLGSLSVESTLNQPLKAVIDLSLDDATSLNGVKVRLASVDAFQHAGIERPYRLSKLTFKTSLLDGKPVILVSTESRMNDPFINVLLDVTWATGQLYRSYTILLDPPGYTMAQSSPPRSQTSYKTGAHQEVNQTVQTEQSSRRVSSDELSYSGVYGPIKKTDDLWDIALKYKPPNASINQVMLGLVRLNPKAFIRGNINELKQGVTLKIPTKQTMFLSNKRSALLEVNAHMNAWKTKENISHVVDLTSKPADIALETSNYPSLIADKKTDGILNNEVSNLTQKNMTLSKDDGDVNQPDVLTVEPESETQTVSNETISAPLDIAEKDKIQRIKPATAAEKEPLFDDFIPIPFLLKTMVKPHDSKSITAIKVVLPIKKMDGYTLETERQKTLNAEVAVAVSAIESVKESNLLLRQQVEMLSNQNTLLKQQLMTKSNQDELIRRHIDLLMKWVEKDSVVSAHSSLLRRESIGQASSPHEKDGFDLWSLLSVLTFLILLTAGSSLVFHYLKKRASKQGANVLDEELMALHNKNNTNTEPEKDAPKKEKSGSGKPAKTDAVKQYNKAVISSAEGLDEQFKRSLKKDNSPKKHPLISNVRMENTLSSDKLDKEEEKIDSAPSSNQPYEILDIEFDITPKAAAKDDETHLTEEKTSSSKEKFDLLDIEIEEMSSEPVTDIKQGKQPYSKEKPVKGISTVSVLTQIALAETYIAMEDWHSAKASLESAITGGNDEQIKKAKELLKQVP